MEVPKKQLEELELEDSIMSNSFKKLKHNEIRHFKTNNARDADTRQGHRMHQITALAGLKRHARTPGSDVFPHTWRTHQRRGISVPRPHLEGNVRPNGTKRPPNKRRSILIAK